MAVLGLAGAAVVLAVFLMALDAKERDNRFCVSCHLHEEKFARLTAAHPEDLSAFHYLKDRQVGCIACHGGAHPVTRLKVWAIAGLDTVKFLAGAYQEPAGMRLPLGDRDCRWCHTPILATAGGRGTTASPVAKGSRLDPSDASTFAAEAETEGRGGTSYHAMRDHDGVRIPCVRCHTSHTTDSDAANRFISRLIVQPLCRECHKDL